MLPSHSLIGERNRACSTKWCIRQKSGRIEKRKKPREKEGARDANTIVLTSLHARREACAYETVAFADRLSPSGGTGQDSLARQSRADRPPDCQSSEPE